MRKLTDAEVAALDDASTPIEFHRWLAIMRGPWLHFESPCTHVTFFAHAHETHEGGPDLRCDVCGPWARYSYSGGLLWITA